MFEGVGQVVIDQVRGQVLRTPRQAAAEYLKLFQVAGGTPDPVAVPAGKLQDRHVVTRTEYATPSEGSGHGWSGRHNRYNRIAGQLAQLVSCRLLSRRVILRRLAEVALAALISVRLLSLILMAWGVGQLAVFFRALFRGFR
jgi:hypothetical protein